MANIRLNQPGLTRIRQRYGIPSDAEFAARIGVDHATVSRVLRGLSAPGNRFIAGTVLAFGHVFHEVFDTVADR